MPRIDLHRIKKSRSFWIIASALIVTLLIIAVGDRLFDFLKPLSLRLLVGSGLFFVILTTLLVRQLYFRNFTTDDMLENARIRSLETANANAVKNRVNVLKKQFSAALKLLKRSSAYKSKRDAHYELPWYFVVGENGEGKTSLIESSGLDFPLQHTQPVSEDHDDGSFQWYFTDDAVLIDIDGKYLRYETASVDAGVWKAFLKLFKQRRWKRPINGIILTLSIDTLYDKSDAALDLYAKQLRDRFDELTVAFTSTIPIYLFITKSDRISGFQEYFTTLSANEKDEILGITFDDDVSMDKSIAEKEFNRLRQRLDASLLERIHAEWDNSARTKVLLFGEELSGVCEKIGTFIETGFASTRYRVPLMLRGIYFTTVFPPRELPKGISDFDSRGCFITKALKNVVFAEAGMARMDTSQKIKEKFRERIALVGAALAVLLILGGWFWDYRIHQTALNEAQRQFGILTKEQRAPDTHSLETTLRYLDRIDSIRTAFQTESTHFWRLAFHKTAERQEKIDRFYYQTLQNRLLPLVADSLNRQILARLSNDNATWDNTKAYLMLSLKEKRNPDFLKHRMRVIWAEQHAAHPSVQKSFNRHWGNLAIRDFKSYEINNQTVQTARNALAGVGQDALLYKQLKDKAMEMNLPYRSFDQAMGANCIIFVGGDHTINGFFTKNGYQRVFSVDGKTLLKQIIKANWVLGFTAEIKEEDLDALYTKIQHYYFEEYKQTWNRALHALHLAPNLSTEQIGVLTSQDSPVIAILKELRANTDIHSLQELVEDKASDAITAKGGTYRRATALTDAKSVRDFFKPYHDLLTQEGISGSTLQAEMTRYANASSQAAAMSESRTPADAFNTVVAKANGGGSAMEVSVLPSPVSRWLPHAVGASTAQLIGDAKKHIQEQYTMLLYPFYKSRIADKYPFNPHTSAEVALVDFETFFGPGGMLDEFQRQYVAPLTTVNPTGKGYRSKSVNGMKVSFSPQFMDSLHQASEIRRALFSGLGLGSAIYIRPHTLGKYLANMSLQYDDTNLIYEHGPIKSKKFVWPSATGNMEIRLSMSDLNDQSVVNTTGNGQWSLFRFFGKMQHTSLGNDEVRVEYGTGTNRASFILTGPAGKTFGPDSPLRRFKLPGKI